MEILMLFAALHCITLCRAVTPASLNSVTNLPVGQDIQFPINYCSDEKYEVTFRRRSPVSLKIMAWNSARPERPYVTHPSYERRVQFHRDAFFVLQGVQLDDEGEYMVQTDYLGTQLRNHDWDSFTLRVFEPVSQPEVVITGKCSSNLKLNCSTARGTKVTCRWERQRAGGVGNDTFQGAVLQLENTPELASHTYTCIAGNPVSEETSDPVTAALCDKDRARGPRNHWIAVLVLVPTISLVMLVSVIVLWRERIRNSNLSRGVTQEIEEARYSLRGGEPDVSCVDCWRNTSNDVAARSCKSPRKTDAQMLASSSRPTSPALEH